MQDQSHIGLFDRIDLSDLIDACTHNLGNPLSDLNEGGLVVEGCDFRTAEDFNTLGLIQGSQQYTHIFTAGRKDESAEVNIRIDSIQAEVRKCLTSYIVSAGERRCIVCTAQRFIVEIKARINQASQQTAIE